MERILIDISHGLKIFFNQRQDNILQIKYFKKYTKV